MCPNHEFAREGHACVRLRINPPATLLNRIFTGLPGCWRVLGATPRVSQTGNRRVNVPPWRPCPAIRRRCGRAKSIPKPGGAIPDPVPKDESRDTRGWADGGGPRKPPPPPPGAPVPGEARGGPPAPPKSPPGEV